MLPPPTRAASAPPVAAAAAAAPPPEAAVLEDPPYTGVIDASLDLIDGASPPSWCRPSWRTTIRLDGAEYHLGYFASRAETAAAHDIGAIWAEDNYATMACE